MRILIACEESGTVTQEFLIKGHDAWSCDILPTSGLFPDRHIQGDVLPLLNEPWDMVIAFPPCTYISNAGARHLFGGGVLNDDRYAKGLAAKKFFLTIMNAPIPKIAIENPVSSKIFNMPQHSQEIQPWQFGHPVTKKTRLWLKNLPPLVPKEIVKPTTNCHEANTWFTKGGKNRQKNRAVTFSGIAKAMAEQWG
jgi:hypothetical protein